MNFHRFFLYLYVTLIINNMKINLFDIPNVTIGSHTNEEEAFQLCNFMNMLYNCIHYSENKDKFSTGPCMSIGVVKHNLTVQVKTLENRIPYHGCKLFKYKDYLTSIYTILETAEQANRKEGDDLCIIRQLCDNLWESIYKQFQERFPEYLKNIIIIK